MPEVRVVVTTRTHRDAVGPFEAEELHVRVTRPPADGQANRAVVRLVAGALGVAPSRVAIVAGARSPRKRLRIDGIDREELARRLRGLAGD